MLACVVDEIVLEGRALITPYFFAPAPRILIPFPSRRRKERYENTKLAGSATLGRDTRLGSRRLTEASSGPRIPFGAGVRIESGYQRPSGSLQSLQRHQTAAEAVSTENSRCLRSLLQGEVS